MTVSFTPDLRASPSLASAVSYLYVTLRVGRDGKGEAGDRGGVVVIGMAALQPHSETPRNAGQLHMPFLPRPALWLSPLLLLLQAGYWRIPSERPPEGRWSLLWSQIS